MGFKPSSYSGLGAATSGGLAYREVPDPGDPAYVYRQFADGSILILQSPRGGAGTLLTADGPTAAAWRAITNAIGAYPAKPGAQVASKAVSTVLSVLQTAFAKPAVAASSYAPSVASGGLPVTTPAPPAAGVSTGLIVGGLAVGGLLLVLFLRGGD